jgi:hypothetical protein
MQIAELPMLRRSRSRRPRAPSFAQHAAEDAGATVFRDSNEALRAKDLWAQPPTGRSIAARRTADSPVERLNERFECSRRDLMLLGLELYESLYDRVEVGAERPHCPTVPSIHLLNFRRRRPHLFDDIRG